MEWHGLDRSGSGSKPVAGSCKHGKKTVEFHKILGSSRVAAQLAASQEGLSSMKLVLVKFPVVWRHSSTRA
jgi:hypothetical protein